MKTITVAASRSYDVLIGNDLIQDTGKYLAELTGSCKVAIVSDSNVWPIYGHQVAGSLETAGFQPIHFVFPAGEESKNGRTYLEILEFLAQNHLTRTDWVIALGGGVVGDITGFSAASYLRGIQFMQIPTTLLSMVDSSVGGKTAIDLAAGKNLAGVFYQPSRVLCDLNALKTLPNAIFQDGCAEVIKYGIVYDEKLFSHLESKGLAFDREAVIARCVELKRDVVVQDEFDTGARQMLNFGHTLGHSIEALSGFSISHGSAVAIGMHLIARAACQYGHCSQETLRRICNILQKFQLPGQTSYTAKQLYNISLSDKKRTSGQLNLILPLAIGQCIINPIPVTELESFIEAGI